MAANDRKVYIYRDGRFRPSSYEATGKFRTEGVHIIDPQGRTFIPRGANVAAGNNNNGGAYPDLAYDAGLRDDMKRRGANTVRLVSRVGREASWNAFRKQLDAGKPEAEARQIMVDELVSITNHWLAGGFVVMLECHDLTYPPPVARAMSDVKEFWRLYAAHYRNNPYVWFNIANEPGFTVEEWRTYHDEVCHIIRNEVGAQNIIVVDGLSFASDTGRDRSTARSDAYLRDPMMAPALIATYGNVVASMHNYGTNMRTYMSQDSIRSWVRSMRRARVPVLIGEVGYADDRTSNIGDYDAERNAAHNSMAVCLEMGVGLLWWSVNHADAYRLETLRQDRANTNPFRTGANLNAAGIDFMNYLSAASIAG